MEIKVFVTNPWEENTVLLYDETGEAVVIDCGCFTENEQERFTRFLEEKHLKLKALLNTHLHIDHIFGNAFIYREYGLQTQAGEADNFLLEKACDHGTMFGIGGMEQPPAAGKFLKDGDRVTFGNTELEVIAVPGHSPGSLCYYNRNAKLLIAGDVLFSGSVGRSDLPGGDGRLLLEGIRTKLFVLGDDVQVIPGHGPSTTIEKEKKYNPFFN